MNTCQICRRVQGRDKNDIVYCRGLQPRKIIDFRNQPSYFRNEGGYPNCGKCDPTYRKVHRNLTILADRKQLQTQKLRFKDPQKKGRAWDTMRFWGLDLTPILKQTMPFYTKEASS